VVASHTIGVDVGGTKCLALAVDADARVLAEARAPTPRDPDALVETIVDLVAEITRSVGPASGVGVGVPGLVNGAGVLTYAPNLPGIHDLEVLARVAERCQVHVVAENDATAAVWAEREAGAAHGVDHVLLITLGTGIGGGIILGGELYRGAHGFAGEIGHMVVDPYGPECPCGKRGCWERFASGTGLGRLARDAAHAGRLARSVGLAGGDPDDVRGEHVTAAASEGDAEAGAVMAAYGRSLAIGLVNLAYLFDPEVFVLGGGLISSAEVVLAPTRAAFRDLLAGAEHRPQIQIVPAELGERAGAIGAALLARG
jgi:glucokinase